MNFMKWRFVVLDSTPMRWSPHIDRQVDTVLVGSIMGLSSANELIVPNDPNVTEIGVMILAMISSGDYIREYPLITNGDNYRRLAIPLYSSIRGATPDFEEIRAMLFGVEDGEIVREAIKEKLKELQ